jgi:tetratricopeptide (TPR) repeat protein
MSRIQAEKTRLRRRFAALGITFAAVSLITWFAVGGLFWNHRPTLERAQQAYEKGDYEAANKIVTRVLRWNKSVDASLLAVKLAFRKEHNEQAFKLLDRVVLDEEVSIESALECGRLWAKCGRLDEVEEALRFAIDREPDNVKAIQNLLLVLRIEGRAWEARHLAANLFRQNHFQLEHLVLVGTLDAPQLNIERYLNYLEFCQEVDSASVLARLAQIRLTFDSPHDIENVKQILSEFVGNEPHLHEPQLILGKLLFENGSDDEFLRWHADFAPSPEAERDPRTWLLRGRWANRRNDTRGAIRCLWESVKRSPDERAAQFLLAKLLVAEERDEDAIPFQKRGELLLEFDEELAHGKNTPVSIVRMIGTLEKLERRWEALGWCQILDELEPESPFVQQSTDRITSQLDVESQLTPDTANPAIIIDLSEYPIPELPKRGRPFATFDPSIKGAIAFNENASDVGLEFRYFVDHTRMKEKVYTFDFAGGGIGVIDFDGNGWPDLYLPQSSEWPQAEGTNVQRNSLFRNVGDRFVEVGELAGVDDRQFGHGTAVGDFNGDGFPDLYVTNLGANVLYLNNGDGTFEDTTQVSGTAGAGYSLSAAFADLSGDGLPDLYVVNYLGDDAMVRQCVAGVRPIQCSPHSFPGQPDRVYLNLGDGRFRDVSAEAGVLTGDGAGKGMGLLVADLDGAKGLDVFVANNTTSNHLYLNGSVGPEEVTLVEQGRTAGVAFDGVGRIQGSSGISVADVNKDGRFDILVTSFENESNNYFSQITEVQKPLFSDRSVELNLARLSRASAGWGAQFIDADNDGDLDLFVANGHMDETLGMPEPQQSPHLFENLAKPRLSLIARVENPIFRLMPSFSDYAEGAYFGRAVATLDWNRDGRLDLCVTHRDASFALLTNTSERQGRFISLELRGTESSRDAIGAVAQVDVGGRRWTVPLTAGDGFSVSNQRQIVIGLGEQDTHVDKVTINWPQGEPQEFKRLPLDSRWLILQGDASPHPLPQ